MNKLYSKAKDLAYSIIDRLTRKKGIHARVNDMKLKLPGRHWRYFPIDYEKENFLFVKRSVKPGSTCLDIGGHIGVYAIYMAKQNAAKVFSFEPTPASFDILQKTISLNHYDHIIVPMQVAIAERSGKNIFYLNSPHTRSNHIDKSRIAEANSLADIDFGKNIAREKIEVITWSIDDLVKEKELKIDFIKIDAEGTEAGILKGAEKTMLTHRPSGLLGIHRYAYADEEKGLSGIWDMMIRYRMDLFHDNEKITREQFMTTHDKGLLDLQFKPSENS